MISLFASSCEDPSALELLGEQGIPATPESLLKATEENQSHLVSLLAESGVSPDSARDPSGRTALMLAVRGGYSEVVEVLTANSKDLDATDDRGMSALAHALCNGRTAIAEELLEGGADPDASCHSERPLLVSSVANGKHAHLQLLLDHGAREGLNEALLIAVTEGKDSSIKKLLAAGADPNTGVGTRRPVLNVALQNRDTITVGLLLDAGAEPNHRDDEGMSAVGYAIKRNHREQLETLLDKGGDVELPCIDELSPVEFAVDLGHPELLAVLLLQGKAAIHPRVVTGAVDAGNPKILGVLLDNGANIDTPDSNGDTLVVRAIRSGDAEQVELLLQRGASIDLLSREGQSLLSLATALKHAKCVATLIAAGADPDAPLISPISDAYREAVGSSTFSYYSKHDSRFTPIMVAASHGDPDTLRALIKGGASRSRYTKSYKRYPISFASEAKHIEAQQLIVGYDPEDRDEHYKIVIDLSKQRAVMYKNGEVHMSSKVSTGKSGYRTPTGEFVVTHKHRTHTSNLYHSSMPYFMRFSCQAFGTHVGHVPNYPASHGCIRMPHNGARAFFNAAPRGTPVSIIN